MLTTLPGQLFFSKPEQHADGTTQQRVTDLSVFGVEDVEIGRWRRLDNETDTRKIVAKYRDGRRVEFNMFRDRK